MKLSLVTSLSIYFFAIHLIFDTYGLGLKPQSSVKRFRRLKSPQPRFPFLLPPIRGQESGDVEKTPNFGGGGGNNGGGNGGGRTRKRGRTISPRKFQRTRQNLKKPSGANENRLPYEHILRARYQDYEERERRQERHQKLRLLAQENQKQKQAKQESASHNDHYHDSSHDDNYPMVSENDNYPEHPSPSKGFNPPRGFQAEAFNPGYKPSGFKEKAPGYYPSDSQTNAKRKHFNIRHNHNHKPEQDSYDNFGVSGYEESSPLPAVPSSLIGHRPDMNKQALVTEAPESALRWVDSKFIHNQHGTFTNQVLTEFVPLENWQSYHQAFSSLVDSNVDSKRPIQKDSSNFAPPSQLESAPPSPGFEDRYQTNQDPAPTFPASRPTPATSNSPRRQYKKPLRSDRIPYPDPSNQFNPNAYYDRPSPGGDRNTLYNNHSEQPQHFEPPPTLPYPELDYYDDPEQVGQRVPVVPDYSDYGLAPANIPKTSSSPTKNENPEFDDGDPLNDFDWDWLKPGYVEEEVSLEPEFRGNNANVGTKVSDRRSQDPTRPYGYRRPFHQKNRQHMMLPPIMSHRAIGSYSEFENHRFWN